MNAMDLWDSFSGLDPELLERSEEQPPKRKLLPILYKTALPLAACAALVFFVWPLFHAGSAGPDFGAASFGAKSSDAAPANAPIGAESMEYAAETAACNSTEAPQSAEPVVNDISQCAVPVFDYAPLPGPFTSVPLTAEAAAALSPAGADWTGEAIYDPEGRLVRTVLQIKVEGTDSVLTLSAAPDLYASDCPPQFRLDSPGDAVITRAGSTELLILGTPIRAPRGTGWNLTVLIRTSSDYALTTYAAPGQLDPVLAAICTLAEDLP